MADTLKNNQIVTINKIAYGLQKPLKGEFFIQWAQPKKQDIVLFLHDNKIVIKRCVLTQDEEIKILYNDMDKFYEKVGITFGGFCPLHQGHLDLIMRSKKENDISESKKECYDCKYRDNSSDEDPCMDCISRNILYGTKPNFENR